MKKAEAPVAGEVVVTGSEEETYRMAEELGSSFQGREVVLLFGDLGAGKTAFTKGLAAGCGVKDTRQVTSPSFTLVNIYEGRFPVFHLDLYRLDSAAEISDLGWEDYLGCGVVVVEWAEKLPFPLEGIRIKIEAGADDSRRFVISRP